MTMFRNTWVGFSIFTFVYFIVGLHCLSLRGRIPRFSAVQERRSPEEPESGQQQYCSLLSAPWTEINFPFATWSHLYRLKISPMSRDVPRRPVFPEQPLFRYVRRVYRCCQKGYRCGSVKGLQGRDVGGSNIEFLLSEDVLSATITRAEIHLHISNPENLNVHPLLPSLEKRHLPTRFQSWTWDRVLEVRVDLLFAFQTLQRVFSSRSTERQLLDIRRVGGLSRALEPQDITPALLKPATAAWGEGNEEWGERPLQAALEMGLALHCSTTHTNTQPCESYGVRLLHTPFITVSYR
ncbi:uncharacterized protein LOC143512720 [Brachyhypopomus gauderio]|uniref:uncharacterized protein LOC143512720 n=1 Tax=Brachyhypopomus gauderio TaxID=698409 RepID=UPI0040438D2C